MTLSSPWRPHHMNTKPCMRLFRSQSTSTRPSQSNNNKSKSLPIPLLPPTTPPPHSCPHATPPTRCQWWKRGRGGHAIDTPPDTTAAVPVRGRLQAPKRKTNMGLSRLENIEATLQIENGIALAPDAAQVISTRQTNTPVPTVGLENTLPATQRDILTSTGVIHLRNTRMAPPSLGSLMGRRRPAILLR